MTLALSSSSGASSIRRHNDQPIASAPEKMLHKGTMPISCSWGSVQDGSYPPHPSCDDLTPTCSGVAHAGSAGLSLARIALTCPHIVDSGAKQETSELRSLRPLALCSVVLMQSCQSKATQFCQGWLLLLLTSEINTTCLARSYQEPERGQGELASLHFWTKL